MDGRPLPAPVKTTCPYCGVGCGVIISHGAEHGDDRGGDNGDIQVSGDPDHPANFGRLCTKGLALGETLNDPARAAYPLMHGRRVSWDAATQRIADVFSRTIDAHGPDSVALYVSGQILTEDYYVANKLMKGYVGTANIDTNSRLCMASSVAGHKRAFGADTVPGTYADLEDADLIIFAGSNFAWCHPVLMQRILAAQERRPHMALVAIDPRSTATSDYADVHLAIAPGSDVPLFLGLLQYLIKAGAVDSDYVDAYTRGFEDAVAAARAWRPKAVAAATGLSVSEIDAFYHRFCTTQKVVTVYSQGVNQAVDGTDRVNAIINCHLATGRIGRPGMGPFSITGQPNAMGGREVGGLANQLACHMDIVNAQHRDLLQRFWLSPTMAQAEGAKAVDLFDRIESGQIKAVWIMATNPVVSMPDADRVKAALERCDLVAVSDVTLNSDTVSVADVVLPSTAWGEKQGMVTNSDRTMSRQRSFRFPPGEARDDWRQICDVARAMGFHSGFDFATVDEIFDEYVRLTDFENAGSRDLDLGGLKGLSADDYADFQPTQWPVTVRPGPAPSGDRRFFAQGQFFTPDRRGVFVAVSAAPPTPVSPDFPLIVNTGRVRDQWHTMTRTGLAPTLAHHSAEPYVDIAPSDAAVHGVTTGDIVEIQSPQGSILVRAHVTDRQREGSMFVPIHWTGKTASRGRVGALPPSARDPVSGQPALKSGAAALRKYNAGTHAFGVLALGDLDRAVIQQSFPSADYWATAAVSVSVAGGDRSSAHGRGVRIELASAEAVDLVQAVQALLAAHMPNWRKTLSTSIYYPEKGRAGAIAVFDGDNRLFAAFYAAPQPVLADRAWVCAHLGAHLDKRQRTRILSGRPGRDMPDCGAVVCLCNAVGARTIEAAIRGGAHSVAAIGEQTSAGTGCGSCRSDLIRMLECTLADA